MSFRLTSSSKDSYCCSTAAEVHTGTVWCLQQKKEVLITGSHDKSVSHVTVHEWVALPGVVYFVCLLSWPREHCIARAGIKELSTFEHSPCIYTLSFIKTLEREVHKSVNKIGQWLAAKLCSTVSVHLSGALPSAHYTAAPKYAIANL